MQAGEMALGKAALRIGRAPGNLPVFFRDFNSSHDGCDDVVLQQL